MNLKSLKTYISDRLETASEIDVYSVKAPIDATFPYLVYNFSALLNNESNQDVRTLEIDYWDNDNNDSSILDASDAVREALHYSWQSESNGFFVIHLDFESEIPDTDDNIVRINQRYLIKARRL